MNEATVQRLAQEVGGRFKLASLLMKRLIEINRGSQLLVEPESDHMLDNVLKEIDLELLRLVPRLPAPAGEETQVEQADEPSAEED